MNAHERIGGQTEADTEKCLRLQKKYGQDLLSSFFTVPFLVMRAVSELAFSEADREGPGKL